MKAEKWLPTIWKGYEVSNTGKVRSIDRVSKHSSGGSCNRKGKILKQNLDSDGYPIVGISGITRKVHRLVALAFLPIKLDKPQVNHKNGIKTDNHVSNLEWCDNSENNKHAYAIGLQRRFMGVDANNAKIDRAGIMAIREAAKLFKQSEIAKYFNVSRAAICNIVAFKTYKYVN